MSPALSVTMIVYELSNELPPALGMTSDLKLGFVLFDLEVVVEGAI